MKEEEGGACEMEGQIGDLEVRWEVKGRDVMGWVSSTWRVEEVR